MSACFNPRAREGRDEIKAERRKYAEAFQSTRPRGARHYDVGNLKPAQVVSIHAPARGATICRLTKLQTLLVSIHAPARGATIDAIAQRNIGARFNPRAREGRDLPTNLFYYLPSQVSIHAPARGATIKAVRPRWIIGGFNPRAREGRDLLII